MATPLYSRNDLVRLSGVPDDALSFWLRREILRSETSDDGPRKHRRFTADTVKIAALLGGARSAGLNIDALASLSDVAHRALAAYRHVGQVGRFDAEVIFADSLDDLKETLRDLDAFRHVTEEERQRLPKYIEASERMATINREDVRLGLALFEANPSGALYAWKNPAGCWDMGTRALVDDTFYVDAAFVIAFDLKRLLSIEFD